MLPITSLGLDHAASSERISTRHPAPGRHVRGQGLLPRQQRAGLRHGRHRQDQPGRPLRRCRLPPGRALPVFRLRGIRSNQIIRNMRSIGIDLEPWVEQGLLRLPRRPAHDVRPGDAPRDACTRGSRRSSRAVVVVDPITNLRGGGDDCRGQVDADRG